MEVSFMNNIETEKTLSSVESIAAQAVLMNGSRQDSPEENTRAEESLEELIAFERVHGNKRLLKIYNDALTELRRGRR
jgi:hypothetical protein